MDFLRHIEACNRHDPAGFLPLRVDGRVVGWVRPGFAQHLVGWKDLFERRDDGVELIAAQRDFLRLNRRIAQMQAGLVERGVLSHLHGEQFPVTDTGPDEALFLVDRASASHFGIRAFGQHLNGFVRDGDRLWMWVARRSADRRNYPNRLDNLAAGGLPYGLGLQENLLKECHEEASIPPDLAARARPVGTVTYNAENTRGFKPDTLYCYDLELPVGFVPRCNDGEVAEFQRLRVEEVMERVGQGDEFKLNCNLVVIDFLIRHGHIGPEHPQYLDLVVGLHPRLGMRGAEPLAGAGV